ncbi:MAG: hypothetical protein IH969_02640 [Candidatus Krumholzibacteriota bacterium]|nr:hypothetical protein [Candidatus Krumholzibacteriota bacterium]
MRIAIFGSEGQLGCDVSAGLGDYDGAETVDLSGCTVIPEDRKRPEKWAFSVCH